MDNPTSILWKPMYTRSGYPYFILDLALDGYVNFMSKNIGWGYRDQIFVSKENVVTSYYSTRDAESFRKFLVDSGSNYIMKVNRGIRMQAEEMYSKMQNFRSELQKCDMDRQSFAVLLDEIYESYRSLYSVYRFPGLVDMECSQYVGTEILHDCLKTKDVCGRAFDYSDSNVLPKVKKYVAQFLGIDESFALFLNCEEIRESLCGGQIIVGENELKDRVNSFVLACVDNHIQLFTREKAGKIAGSVAVAGATNATVVLKGTPACKGQKVTGQALIAFEVSVLEKAVPGLILITPMTTIAFVPFLKKFSGIVTDEGGITCHAAIISRELAIPCVIGTKNATKIFRDGDLVEVDATLGLITKIS